MSIAVMKQALEALEQINQLSIGENAIALPGEIDAALDNLRAAIEQAEKQEPVAWMGVDAEGNPNKFRLNKFGPGIPLYTKDDDL